MTIRELIAKYQSMGLEERKAISSTAQKIIIDAIASSELKDRILLKGGIVMFNLTKNIRRATMDIDFDIIHYDLSRDSIERLISKLDEASPDYSISIIDGPFPLHQEDYKGVRIYLKIRDYSWSIKTKVDIGVHTLFGIEQKAMAFTFLDSEECVVLKVNPIEQIAAEKIYSLFKHEILSKRYKDISDIYYLINEEDFNKETFVKCLEYFTIGKKITIDDIVDSVISIIEDKNYQEKVRQSKSLWTKEKQKTIIMSIVSFLESI